MSRHSLQTLVEPHRENKKPPDFVSRQGDGRIYTRSGDAGRTKLADGPLVWKDDARVWVYGTLDEATSAMGMARATTRYDDICRDILDLQGELIGVMAELATPAKAPSSVIPMVYGQVERLEKKVDAYEEERITIGQFVRPGGSVASSGLDLARSIVRRAERLLVALSRAEGMNPVLLQYLNRLSDLLYVMARIDEQREIRRLVMSTLQSPVALAQNGENTKVVLSLATCDRLIEAGIRRAQQIGVPMVLAVVDEGGNLVALRRMDGALVVSITLAPHKAFTAATIRMPTQELANLAQPGAPLYGIDVNMPNLTLVGGGLPLAVGGVTAGGVGVSGGSVEQDVVVAQAMIAAFEQGE